MVTNLFKFEFRKLFRSVSFYVLLGIALLTILFATYIIIDPSFNAEHNIVFSSNVVAGLIVQNSPFTTIVIVFLSIFLCNDHTDSTVKNIYARGVNRTTYYFVRLAVSAVVITIYCVLCFGFELLSTSFLTKTFNIDYPKYLLATYAIEFLSCLTYTAFVLFVSTFAKRFGGCLAFVIIIPSMVELILAAVESRLIFNEIISYDTDILQYWFTEVETNITYAYDDILSDSKYLNLYDKFYYIKNALILIVWSGLFSLFGWLIARNDQQ